MLGVLFELLARTSCATHVPEGNMLIVANGGGTKARSWRVRSDPLTVKRCTERLTQVTLKWTCMGASTEKNIMLIGDPGRCSLIVMLTRREQRRWARRGDARVCVRSSKQKGKTLEIREPTLHIVTTDISGYVLMALVCICYFDNNMMLLPVTEGYWRKSLRDTQDSPSPCFTSTYVLWRAAGWTAGSSLLSDSPVALASIPVDRFFNAQLSECSFQA